MEFTEMEKRMLYQTEGSERYAVLQEMSMASRYAGDPARRKAAKSLLEKLRPLTDVQVYGGRTCPMAALCGFRLSRGDPRNYQQCKRQDPYHPERGEGRQLIIMPVVIADFVSGLGEERGAGGFGSTGGG